MVQRLCLLLASAELLILAGNTLTSDDFSPARNFSSVIHSDANAYLQELANYWPYNDTFHLSKFEEFDHTHFDDSQEEGAASTEPYPALRAQAAADPVFDEDMATNVTAPLGGTAILSCRVRNLAERPLSWVRKRDWHILTSGLLTYSNDERFQVAHSAGSDDWELHIKYVQRRDNGTYECQVSTGSGTIRQYFELRVIVSSAFILGSGEYHIGEGSTISLVCVIENIRKTNSLSPVLVVEWTGASYHDARVHWTIGRARVRFPAESPSPPHYVLWYHNDQMINYDSTRGGVTISTDPGPKTQSRLIINGATRGDSGNYTCRASNSEADTIHVFVSRGDNTAAIQRQESSSSSSAEAVVGKAGLVLLPAVMLARQRCFWVTR